MQEGVYDAFTTRLAETAGTMKVADGFKMGAVISPLIDMKAVEKVEAYIADAVKKGAKVVTGGKRAAQGGSFYEPTVLTDVTTDMVITRRRPSAPSPRSTASRPRPTRSRWPTTPNSVSPPISTAATSAASGASPKRSNTASSASTRASSRRRPAGEVAPCERGRCRRSSDCQRVKPFASLGLVRTRNRYRRLTLTYATIRLGSAEIARSSSPPATITTWKAGAVRPVI